VRGATTCDMSPEHLTFRITPLILLVCAALLCGVFVAAPGTAGSADLLNVYLGATSERLAAPMQGALRGIEDAPRQLLAVRSYLRSGPAAAARWSWSQQEIRAFSGSPQHRDLLAAVERVRGRFARRNPGYTLYANTEPRSLDVQIQRWNDNAGVERVARALHRDASAELRAGDYPAAPSAASIERFASFLRDWRPPSAAPLAAPGLSKHGQLKAVDFQVMQNGRVVAAAEMASVRAVWEGQGWGRKLRAAVGDEAFSGPLQSPNEPWHYEYLGAQRHGDTRVKPKVVAIQ
jgi:hypothetical protein